MNFLKIIPLSRRRLDVLFEIYAEKENYLRNISKSLKINPSLSFSILKKLIDSNFLVKSKRGREVMYSLDKNRDYGLLVSILEEYHLESALEKNNVLRSMLNLLVNNKDLIETSDYICVFGSYAVGGFTKHSDIDILFVNKNKKLVIRSCREISLIIGKEVNPLIYARERFDSELKKKEPLLSSIVNNIRNRIIIKGCQKE